MGQQVRVYRELKFLMSGQVIAYGDFTDGGGTSGYIDLTDKLPAYAIPIGFKAIVLTAFAGDSSAIIQVGVSGDTDRFSETTNQSIFATGTVGSLAPSDACNGMNAAQTIRVTVTSGSAWSAVTAGVMRVIVYYIGTV